MNRLRETLKRFCWLLQEFNKRRKMEINNHKSYSRWQVIFTFDVVTSNVQLKPRWMSHSRQYFGFRSSRTAAEKHYRWKTLLFAVIKVSTFICKRENINATVGVRLSFIRYWWAPSFSGRKCAFFICTERRYLESSEIFLHCMRVKKSFSLSFVKHF